MLSCEELWMGAYLAEAWRRQAGDPPAVAVRRLLEDAVKKGKLRPGFKEHQVRSFARRWQKGCRQ